MTLETRDFEIREADTEERTVTGIAVPWDDEIAVGGYRERFAKGAVKHRETTLLMYGHDEPIGKISAYRDTDEGHEITAKISQTNRGDEVLTLLRDGVLTKFSVGFKPVVDREEDGVVIREEVDLREVSVVPIPAYDGARVTNVRSDLGAANPKERTEAHMSDSNVAAEVTELRGAIEELDRKVSTVAQREDEKPAIDTRSAGELVKAAVEGDDTAINTLNRAYEGGIQADGINKPAGLVNLIRIFDSSSGVLSQIFSTGTLPATGNTLEFAELDTNTLTVTEQVAEGDDIPMGRVKFKTRTVPVKTYAGGAELSRQAIERSTVGVLNTTLEGLALEAGKRKKLVLRAAFDSVVTARQGIASNGGVVVLGATLAAATAGHWEDALIDAAIKYDGLAITPEALIVSGSVFKKLRSLTVSGERVFTVADKNASGQINLIGLSGNFAGLPVYLDPAATGDSAVFVNGRAIRQYDSALISLSDDKISNLTKAFAVYRYGAVADEMPFGVVPVKLAAS